MSDKGFVKIDRGIMDHWTWEDRPFSKGQAWIDLILLANYKDVKRIQGGKVVTLKRGTVNRSIVSLANRWGWSRKKTILFLNALNADGMLSKNSTRKGTTLTIENYEKYQKQGQQREQQKSNRGTTEEQLRNINKKEKKDKKEKEKTFPVSEYGFDPSEEMTPEQLDIYFKWKKANDVAI